MNYSQDNVKELLSLLKSSSPEDKELIKRAYKFTYEAHKEQRRFSGEPYFNHAYATAKTLAELGMDARTVAAGLLHDTLEDGQTSEAMLEKEFGKEVTFLIKGVTKLGKYKYHGVVRHAESLRKLFLAISKDVRVLIIRLADRLHNMQTLWAVREGKRKRIALETLEIYAPVANRLGMGRIKGDLQDLAFPHCLPKEFAEVKILRKERSKNAMKRLEKVHRTLYKKLSAENITIITTDYRVKHLYSLYKKLLRYDKDIEKIHDIAALRIVVSSVGDCYRVLGIIHNTWRPLTGKIKDYIASPKPNGYQSLHTTIFTGDGGIVEIQIRTREMHEEAEYGIAAYLAYKPDSSKTKKVGLSKKLSWIQELVEWQKQVSESKEFLENIKVDFFKDRVFVFTPKGDVVDLPEDSSPIDFAYAIHSDIGSHLAGAKINNKLVSLNTKLANGDIVEIVTKQKSSPSSKWLAYAKTTLAKKHIKAKLAKNKKY